jgi:hypothetical protein
MGEQLSISKSYFRVTIIINTYRSAMPNEKGLSTPFEGNVLTLRDVVQFNFNFSQSQNIS